MVRLARKASHANNNRIQLRYVAIFFAPLVYRDACEPILLAQNDKGNGIDIENPVFLEEAPYTARKQKNGHHAPNAKLIMNLF